MTRLLLITEDHTQALSLSAALSSAADFQTVHKLRLAEARGAIAAGAFEAAVLLPAVVDTEFCAEVAAARAAFAPLVLLVVLPAGTAAAEQTSVITAGADSVLFQPADVRALAAVLTRLTARAAPPPSPDTGLALPPASGRLNARAAALSNALEVLRDFSQVLGYSLDYRQLTHHFTLKLREVIGLTRIAIFLEPGATEALPERGGDDTRLACAAAIGLPADLVECFALSRRSGIGRQLSLQPQILRAPQSTLPPFLDPKIAREFEVLGGQVAIPVNDRERTLGVAVLGGRITGGEFSDDELLLVYHLLEELGIAVKNSWLHHQLVGSHRLLGNVLNGLTVGALVVGPRQQVVYANRTIGTFLGSDEQAALDLAALPADIARPLHDVIVNGRSVEPFFHEAGGASPRVFRVSIIPVHATAGKLPQTALLLLEDFTQTRAVQRAEIESSNLKLIGLIARRFAHEIRNSLVPLTTHAQLFDAQIGDGEFRDSLKTALHRETQRIQRFTDQMLLLARSDQPAAELASLEDLLRGSFEKSRAYTGGEGTLELKSELPPVWLRCNRASLAHAFQEIFLNGLQSGAASGRRLTVALDRAPGAESRDELRIRVQDSGTGFDPDAAPRALEPFFTTRNTGVGLGLTIARRVIEAHRGRLEVHTRAAPSDPDLTIRLPLPR